MAKLIYALNVSLDGYVDHDRFAPDPVLFQHFVEDVGGIAGALYGRRMYELMRYWDEDQPDWDAPRRAYAAAWRSRPKWVVSRNPEVGPNAAVLLGDLETAVRALKAGPDGDIEVAGPVLAGALIGLDLIDEYRLYLHPVALGAGRPYFTGPVPRLHLTAADRIGPEAIRLTYVPAPSTPGQ